MLPKEKAEELVNKFMETKSLKLSDYSRIEFPTAKQCALICVDEIMRVVLCEDCTSDVEVYWQEVKQEINKQ